MSPRVLSGSIIIKAIRGKAHVWAQAGEVYEIVREGAEKQLLISAKKPVTVKVAPESRATLRSASGQVLIVESSDDGFTHEEKIAANKLRPLREGRYSVLLPPQK